MSDSPQKLVLPLGQQRPTHVLWWAAAGFFAAGLALFAVDLAVAQWARSKAAPGDLRKLVTLAEVFAHGAGVALIGLALFAMDRRRWPRACRVLACAYGAGLLANLGKLAFSRTRPHAFFERLSEGGGESIWATFNGVLPNLTGVGGEHGYHSPLQSIPSAHAATAVGLAVALALTYRHAAGVFVLYATLAGLQRIEAGAHYPSDVAFGAVVGCLAGVLFFGRSRLARFFDGLEARHEARVAAQHQGASSGQSGPRQADADAA